MLMRILHVKQIDSIMPRASNRTSDDVYMWLEQESATRGTANCVTDFFYRVVVFITVQNHDNLESLCVTG